MKKKLSVLVVDDHQIFSQSLKLLLNSLQMFAGVDSCYSGEDALKLIDKKKYDLLLLDWNLGDANNLSGALLVTKLIEKLPNGRVVILSGYVASGTVFSAIDAGAASYLPKTISADHLIEAIQLIVAGGIYLPHEVMPLQPSQKLSKAAATDDVDKTQTSLQTKFPHLSSRQVEVLLLVLKGMNNRLIAENLCISEGTVKQHLNLAFREMGVRNRTEAIYNIAQNGLQIF